MIVKTPAGATVLTIPGDGFNSGYALSSYDEGQRSWRRITTSSPRIDGEFDVASALARTTLTVVVYIVGSTAADARSKHRALLAAVEVTGWLLDVDGSVVWRCEKADSSVRTLGTTVTAKERLVTLTIPAQPVYGI